MATPREREKIVHPALALAVALGWLGGIVAIWKLGDQEPRAVLQQGLASYLALWGLFFLLSRAPRELLIGRFILVSVGLGLPVLVGEALTALGWVDYRAVFQTPTKPWSSPYSELHDDLLHRHHPGQRLQGVVLGDLAIDWGVPLSTRFEYDIRYDRHGFRNPEDLDRATVAVVGDSFVEAGNVGHEELVTTRLAGLLSESVANLGQVWYGPQQERWVLENVALPLKPEVVVWMFFEGNDLDDVRRYQEATKNWQRFSAPFHSFQARSLTWNALLTTSGLLRQSGQPKSRFARERSGLFSEGDTEQQIWFGYQMTPLEESDDAALAVVSSVLADAQRRVTEQDSRLLVVFVPTKYRVYAPVVRYPDGSLAGEWEMSDLNRRLRDMVAAIDPPPSYLDLTPSLQQAARDGALLYFPDDTHWSPAGHDSAANLIAAEVRRLLPTN